MYSFPDAHVLVLVCTKYQEEHDRHRVVSFARGETGGVLCSGATRSEHELVPNASGQDRIVEVPRRSDHALRNGKVLAGSEFQ